MVCLQDVGDVTTAGANTTLNMDGWMEGRWSDEIGARRENGKKETKGKAKNGHD